jgi:hypothetical protein
MPNPAVNPAAIANVLDAWLAARLTTEQTAWFNERCQAVSQGDKKALFLAFGLVTRKLSKADLALSSDERNQAESTRPGWNPTAWTIDQTARAKLVLLFPASDPAAYVAVLDQLFAAGEMHELIALYQSLPLLPHQPAHALRCAEGIRTNIKSVFLAIAHNNPFPIEQLNDDQWSQLVLKCLFVGVTLDPVIGLDRRANAPLAKMLTDFAHERWAAGRSVSPELWRCVGPFANDAMLADLQRVLTTGNELERQGAVLALSQCPHPQAKSLLVDSGIDPASTNWTTIAASI